MKHSLSRGLNAGPFVRTIADKFRNSWKVNHHQSDLLEAPRPTSLPEDVNNAANPLLFTDYFFLTL